MSDLTLCRAHAHARGQSPLPRMSIELSVEFLDLGLMTKSDLTGCCDRGHRRDTDPSRLIPVGHRPSRAGVPGVASKKGRLADQQ